ncbi:hypothetical protein M2157_009784 [Streptomyces sp. SAI-127]|nr:hypothetical protein [Streptomyces sp. SAI-127]
MGSASGAFKWDRYRRPATLAVWHHVGANLSVTLRFSQGALAISLALNDLSPSVRARISGDVADALGTLRAAALGQARSAHPAPGARTTVM